MKETQRTLTVKENVVDPTKCFPYGDWTLQQSVVETSIYIYLYFMPMASKYI